MKRFFIGIITLCISILLVVPIRGTIHKKKQRTIALVDTADRDVWLYKPFIDIVKSVGFKVAYKPLDAVIDQSRQEMALAKYDGVIFIFGTEFLASLERSYLCAKVLELVEQYARMPGVMVGLVFPSLNVGPGMNIISTCAPIFNRLGIQVPCNAGNFLGAPQAGLSDSFSKANQQQINSFCHIANIFLTTPLETRPLQYHTTLNMPRGGIAFDLNMVSKMFGSERLPLYLLPINNNGSAIIRQTLPYGLYWFNPVRHNHVFLTTTTLLSFSGVSENFQICPVNFMLRHEMLRLTQRMMWEVAHLMTSDNRAAVMSCAKAVKHMPQPPLPQHLARMGRVRPYQKLPHAITQEKKIAWMEINVFDDVPQAEVEKDPHAENERETQRSQLIEYILDSGLDGLWITFNPHMYYSPLARLPKKSDEQSLIRMISRFTKALSEACAERDIQPPHILLGYEITNNIYPPHLPTTYAIDLYENSYKDLPAPTDMSFWQTEVIDPLHIFAKKWNDPEVSYGIKLSGVVLDLEMYCRKHTGTFFSTMGFDAQTFKAFGKQHGYAWDNVAVRDRILLLIKHKLGRSYFSFLEQETEHIGRLLQKEFVTTIPDCQIICYLPHVNVTWFYKGLYKGLSNEKRPLMLLTFNSEFFAHEGWFKKNNINAYHSSVLLLSKLSGEQDFSWVDELLRNHHGIWLNRFSRFVEKKARDWTSVEQPRMSESLYQPFMDYLNAK